MTNSIEIGSLRNARASERRKKYWRSLEEFGDTPDFRELTRKQFPNQSEKLLDPVNRRNFLKVMGASLAMSGLSACVQRPTESIVPYVNQPEEVIPGKALYFATAMPLGGYGYPLLVENHMGRPTKIEGNPEHTASLGAAFAIQQAAMLGLYDPDRSRTVINLGQVRGWPEFVNAITLALEKQRASGGAGFRLLTEGVSSPTLASQINQLLKDFPQAKWIQYEAVSRANPADGARLAFSDDADVHYDFSKADVVLSLDADFMAFGPGAMRYAKDFSARKRVRSPQDKPARFYAVESCPTPTGTKADNRFPMRPSEIESFALSLAAAVGVPVKAPQAEQHRKIVDSLVRDLKTASGRSIVIAGDHLSPQTHALVLAVNQQLQNFGKTVLITEPVHARAATPAQNGNIIELAGEMGTGKVDLLLILGGNPVYDAPHDLLFAEKMKKVGMAARLGLYEDETSRYSHWHVPEAHFLESWSDVRTYDGQVSIVQPLIAPLYMGKTAHEVLGAILGQAGVTPFEIVNGYWKQQRPGNDFDNFWRRTLHDGFVEKSSAAPKNLQVRSEAIASEASSASADGIELSFRPDPALHDGRFANLAWLQELPRPFTKICWDNVALVSPATAEKLKIEQRALEAQMVEVKVADHGLELPVFILPGHANDCMTVFLGGGREYGGTISTGISSRAGTSRPAGFDTYRVRLTGKVDRARATVRNLGSWYQIARTQLHHNIDNSGISGHEKDGLRQRDLVMSAELEEYRQKPDFVKHEVHPPALDNSLYNEWDYRNPPKNYLDTPYAWGMSIDIGACIGCSACVVACVAENNIQMVGKKEVRRQHEMHWLRVDQYFWGDLDNPLYFNQPLPCMHCEMAPCEYVCPVGATEHSREGLNDMVYNRCVGTRFCSNNCPYKVRRFNWFAYADFKTPQLKLLNNPDVTVRSRGVMEKCTFCVQRINQARIQAAVEGRRVRDGEVVTACAATCPVDAIIFGDINDPNSQVRKLKENSLTYGLLTDLNTRPRTTYIATVTNPNKEVEKA